MTKASKVIPSVAPKRLIDATIPFKAIAPILETLLFSIKSAKLSNYSGVNLSLTPPAKGFGAIFPVSRYYLINLTIKLSATRNRLAS